MLIDGYLIPDYSSNLTTDLQLAQEKAAQAAGGVAVVELPANGTLTLTTAQARYHSFRFVRTAGALTGTVTVIVTRGTGVPSDFLVEHGATGANVIVKVTSGGTGYTLRPGMRGYAKTLNGTDVAPSARDTIISSGSGAPTTTHFPNSGDFGLYESSSGKRYWCVNSGGTLYTVELT